MFNRNKNLYNIFEKHSFLKNGIDLSRKYLDEICYERPEYSIKYKKVFFGIYKDIATSEVISLGEEIIKKDPDPEFIKVLAVRYKRLGNIYRYEQLLVKATGRNYLIRSVSKKQIELVLENLSISETKIRVKQILIDFPLENLRIYELLFSILKDKYLDIAIEYGMAYFYINPFNIKFITVLENRLILSNRNDLLLRIVSNRKDLSHYKKIINGPFFKCSIFNRSKFKLQLKAVSNQFPESFIERYIDDVTTKYSDNVTEIYKSASAILKSDYNDLSAKCERKYDKLNKLNLKMSMRRFRIMKLIKNIKIKLERFIIFISTKNQYNSVEIKNDIKNIIASNDFRFIEKYLDQIVAKNDNEKYKIYELIFSLLKDSHTSIAVKYGKLFFDKYPDNKKFVRVLVKRLQRINDDSIIKISKKALQYNNYIELEFLLFKNELSKELNKCEKLFYDNKLDVLEIQIRKIEKNYFNRKDYVFRALHKFFFDKDYSKSEYYGLESLKIKRNEYVIKDLYDLHITYGSLSKALAVIPKDIKLGTLHIKMANINSLLDLYANGFDMDVVHYSKEYRPVKKKVLYLLHNRLPHNTGGYATRSHGLISGLVNYGWDINGVSRLGYPWDKNPNLDSLEIDEIDGIAYHRLTKDGIGLGKLPLKEYLEEYALKLLELALKEKPEIIHAASNYMNGVVGNYVAKCLGIKFVYEVRGLWEITRISRQPEWKDTEYYNLMVKMETEAAISADVIMTLTQALKNELISRGVDENKIELLPNGVTSDRFVPKERNSIMEYSLNLEGNVVIGYIGSVVAYEGLELLVEAVGFLVEKDIKNICVLIVGDGAVLQSIKDYVIRCALDKYFIFTGRVPHEEVEDYYSLVDIAPFPRKGQPVCEMVSPLKPFEAMAMEIAVLSSNVDALAEIVEDNFNGLLFEKDNSKDLAIKLEKLILNKDLRLRLGRQSRKWVLKHRDWDVISNRLHVKYNKLLEEN